VLGLLEEWAVRVCSCDSFQVGKCRARRFVAPTVYPVKNYYLDKHGWLRYTRYVSTQTISVRDFPSDLYKRIKMEAIKRGCTVGDILAKAAQKFLNGKEK
jgi:hypothetical protein